ncbi:MAG TPA: PAS domain-containing protein [Synergistaceae bacterium]|nr:PAS domain-containing protein [Synergistaceae bacterium]
MAECGSDHDRDRQRLLDLFQQKGFRLIFEEAPFAIALKDRHNHMLRANPYVERLTGKVSTAAEGLSMEELFPQEGARFFDQDREVLRTGSPLYGLLQRYETPSGELLWTLADKIPFRDEEGAVAGILVFERDITEYKRAERIQAALYHISETARGEAPLEALYADVHRILADLMPAKNFYIALCDREQTTVRFVYHVDEKDDLSEEEWHGVPLQPLGLSFRVIQKGTAILYDHAACMAMKERGQLRGTIPSEWLGAPLRAGNGEVFGIVAVQTYDEGVRYPPRAMEILNFMATQVANALEHRRHAEALAASQRELARNVAQLQKSWDQTLEVLSRTSEAHDIYTVGHQSRVAELAAAIASLMHFSPERVHGVRMAALVHDLGTITVPSEVLCKPGVLSEDEYALVKLHPSQGQEILKRIELPWPLGAMVLQHHERMDGSGYPQGLRGEEILPEARIIAVADVVEAMNAHRPYRSSLGMAAALEEISRHRGTKYDPGVVDACLAVIDRGTVPWVAALRDAPPPRLARPTPEEEEDLSDLTLP